MSPRSSAPLYIELWNGFRANKFRILAAVVTVAVLTLMVSLVLPKTYEGVLLIRIGQISIDGQTPTPIEEPRVVLDRLRNAAFLQRVAERVYRRPEKELALYTRGTPARTMEIRARRGSVRESADVLQATFVELRSAHEAIAAPYMTISQKAVDEMAAKIGHVELQQKKALERIASTAAWSNEKSVMGLLVGEIVRSDIADLREKEMNLRLSLAAPFTYMTEMVEPIYVDDEPIYPKPLLNVIVAIVLVIAISVFLIGLRVLQSKEST